jgi:hypothetical protein
MKRIASVICRSALRDRPGIADGCIIRVGDGERNRGCPSAGADPFAASSMSETGQTRRMLVLVGRVHRLVLIACFGACMTQVAAATDMGVFSLTPPSPQNKDWSGFYSRSGSSDGPGPSWMNSTGMNSTSFSSPGASRPATTSDSFGYNLQKGNFVFGVEGSFSAANFDGRFTSPSFTAAGAWSPNMNWLGTVTGRFGECRIAAAGRPARRLYPGLLGADTDRLDRWRRPRISAVVEMVARA